MRNLRIQSVQVPFDDAKLAAAAIGALSRADAMGLLSRQVTGLDGGAMRELGIGMAEAGIGKTLVSELRLLPETEPTRLCALLKKINDALDESPAPEHEWQSLRKILGLELLTRLLGVSQSSAQRYLLGSRSTPDEVAARLHFLALVVGDLAGAYNEIGVRRWFDRPRKLLGGTTPAGMLVDPWLPEYEGPQRIKELSQALLSSGVT